MAHMTPDIITQIIEAGLTGNHQRLQLLSLTAIRTLKATKPHVAAEIGALLSRYTANSASLRWHSAEPPPTDADAGLSLIRIQPTENAAEPILDPANRVVIARFLKERNMAECLLREGIAPPRSMLFKGPPGTGKTMLAYWLAKQMTLPLAVLDLATSISSFLGKTGANIRRSLDYARSKSCVFLLDEFDAIAKRRDDQTEVGELKRIVNVLLKELEEWPLNSILIAATNHPELLDPAINRRFDVVLNIQLPAIAEREAILIRAVGQFSSAIPDGFITAVAGSLKGASASDIVTFAQGVVRRHLIEKIPITTAFVEGLLNVLPYANACDIGLFAHTLREVSGLSVREIAELVGKGSSTIQYHLRKYSHTPKEPDNA